MMKNSDGADMVMVKDVWCCCWMLLDAAGRADTTVRWRRSTSTESWADADVQQGTAKAINGGAADRRFISPPLPLFLAYRSVSPFHSCPTRLDFTNLFVS